MLPTEMELIDLGNIGSIISILASLLLIQSNMVSAEVTQAGEKGITLEPRPKSSEIALKAVETGFISSTITLIVAWIRLQQLARDRTVGKSTYSLIPNEWIVLGAILSVIASIAFIIGVGGRVAEEARITIL